MDDTPDTKTLWKIVGDILTAAKPLFKAAAVAGIEVGVGAFLGAVALGSVTNNAGAGFIGAVPGLILGGLGGGFYATRNYWARKSEFLKAVLGS